MRILVVRHGETPGNRDRVLQVAETPLSERGVGQAVRLAERIAAGGAARILASDLRRAAMTAEIVQQRTGLPLEHEPLLQERNFGDLRGTPYSRLEHDIFAPDYEPPGGESWPRFHERVVAAWSRVVRASAEAGGDLVVVTHGLVCRVLAERHLALPSGIEPPTHWGNTSLTVVDAPAPHLVRVLNCTAHLEGGDGEETAPL